MSVSMEPISDFGLNNLTAKEPEITVFVLLITGMDFRHPDYSLSYSIILLKRFEIKLSTTKFWNNFFVDGNVQVIQF